jgi:ABC-type sugar transport system substrate-binding protein
MTGLRIAFGFLAAAAGLGVVICGVDAIQCQQAAVPRLAFITAGSSPFWQRVAAGAQAAADAHGLNLEVCMPERDGDPLAQSRLLDALDRRAFGGVAVCPVDVDAQSASIGRLTKELKVLAAISDTPASGRLCFVGVGDYAAGRVAAEEVCRRLPLGGKVVAIISSRGGRPAADRIKGFQEEMACRAAEAARLKAPTCELVEYLDDRASAEEAARQLREALREHADLACAVSLSDRGGKALAQLIADAQLTGRVHLITFDQSAQALDEVAQGRIQAVIAADPYKLGFVAASWLGVLCRADANGLPARDRGYVYVPSLAVTQDNVGTFRSVAEPSIALPSS